MTSNHRRRQWCRQAGIGGIISQRREKKDKKKQDPNAMGCWVFEFGVRNNNNDDKVNDDNNLHNHSNKNKEDSDDNNNDNLNK